MTKMNLPTYDALMNPVIQALESLGGSGTIEEINSKVTEIVGLSDEQLEVLHNPNKGVMTELEYRLSWSRTYLKTCGLLENSSRGIWVLTPAGSKVDHVDERKIVRAVQQLKKTTPTPKPSLGQLDTSTSWREELTAAIMNMAPSAFERLIQRILRESGFVQVEVSGRSGDGGIDGRGIMRVGGLLSFHVIFQCKRWRGAVSASHVRDFRGAMVGRADKGLLIATGTFTKDAVKEATRDGAPAIDLVDGEQLLDKLKELSLGVRTRRIEAEEISIDHDWFLSI